MVMNRALIASVVLLGVALLTGAHNRHAHLASVRGWHLSAGELPGVPGRHGR